VFQYLPIFPLCEDDNNQIILIVWCFLKCSSTTWDYYKTMMNVRLLGWCMGFKCNMFCQCYFLVTIVNACWWKTIWECWDSPSPTCGSVYKSQYIISIRFYFHALALVASPRPWLQHNSIIVYVIKKNYCSIILKIMVDLQVIHHAHNVGN
jgi:hypothetical protein